MERVTIPLSMLRLGERARLSSVKANDGLTNRLNALGLTSGVEVRVIQDAGGPLLVSVRDSRVALGHGMAQKIYVELLEGGKA